jgi:hypothetical protein
MDWQLVVSGFLIGALVGVTGMGAAPSSRPSAPFDIVVSELSRHASRVGCSSAARRCASSASLRRRGSTTTTAPRPTHCRRLPYADLAALLVLVTG